MIGRFMMVMGLLVALIGATVPVTAQTSPARVRVVHAAEKVPAVDVLLDGNAVLKNVGFVSVSDYLDVPAGAHKIALTPAGQSADAALFTQNVTVDGGKAYTVIGVGRDDVQIKLYTDDVSAPPAGKARIRAIHTLPDAPAVDIQAPNGPRIFENLSFPNASDYALLDAGTYNLQLVANGANTVFKQWPNREYKAGVVYDVIVFGSLANLQTRVAQTTPMASTMGGGAPANATVMPNTGAESNTGLLLGLGVALLGLGVASRRRWA